MKEDKLKSEKIKELTNKNETAITVSEFLANRQRVRQHINITRLKILLVKDGKKIVNEDYEQYWKDLESERLGQIIYTRYGNFNIFHFFYDLRIIGKLGIGEVFQPTVKPIIRPPGRKRIQPETQRFPFRLSIEIPDNLEDSKLKKILNYIKGL